MLKVNSSMQGVPLAGAGTRRIVFQYRPTGLRRAATVSLTAIASALIVLCAAGLKAPRHLQVRTDPGQDVGTLRRIPELAVTIMVAAGIEALMSNKGCLEGGENRTEHKPDVNSRRGRPGFCDGLIS